LASLNDAISAMKSRVESIYLHIDMDVVDTEQGQPNHLATPGGLGPQVIEAANRAIKMQLTIAAGTIASYDPESDEGNSICNAGIRLVKAIAADSWHHRWQPCPGIADRASETRDASERCLWLTQPKPALPLHHCTHRAGISNAKETCIHCQTTNLQ
jgi:hypothetical protein